MTDTEDDRTRAMIRTEAARQRAGRRLGTSYGRDNRRARLAETMTSLAAELREQVRQAAPAAPLDELADDVVRLAAEQPPKVTPRHRLVPRAPWQTTSAALAGREPGRVVIRRGGQHQELREQVHAFHVPGVDGTAAALGDAITAIKFELDRELNR